MRLLFSMANGAWNRLNFRLLKIDIYTMAINNMDDRRLIIVNIPFLQNFPLQHGPISPNQAICYIYTLNWLKQKRKSKFKSSNSRYWETCFLSIINRPKFTKASRACTKTWSYFLLFRKKKTNKTKKILYFRYKPQLTCTSTTHLKENSFY